MFWLIHGGGVSLPPATKSNNFDERATVGVNGKPFGACMGRGVYSVSVGAYLVPR